MSSPTPQSHPPLQGLYLVLDREVAGERSLAEITRCALDGGCRLFQYREKQLPKNEMYRIATELRAITAQDGATFIVNDFSDVALAVQADGVHLGQDDFPLAEARNILGPDQLIGISTHSIEQAIEAEKGGADYIGVGPMYQTNTKKTGLAPLGPDEVGNICAHISIPSFGIGGINFTHIQELQTTGLSGVAVLSAILQAYEIEATVRRFMTECHASF